MVRGPQFEKRWSIETLGIQLLVYGCNSSLEEDLCRASEGFPSFRHLASIELVRIVAWFYPMGRGKV